MDRSPVEVAVLVIAGLIDGCDRRAEAMIPLTAAVAAAVAELAGGRNTAPTWRQELDPWHLDALDRLRLAHDDLLILEAQAGEIVLGLRAMLTPGARLTYGADYRRLTWMAEQRKMYLERLRLAENRLRRPAASRPALSHEVGEELSRARRLLVAEEARGSRQLHRLGSLLSMDDQVLAS